MNANNSFKPSRFAARLNSGVRPLSALRVNARPYESADLAGIIETYTASIHKLAAPYYSPQQIMAWVPVPPDPARWQERLAALHTVVAESDGVLAGFASHTPDGYLDFLFTHPDYARSGVASRLYQIAESALRRHASLVPREPCSATFLRPQRL